MRKRKIRRLGEIVGGTLKNGKRCKSGANMRGKQRGKVNRRTFCLDKPAATRGQTWEKEEGGSKKAERANNTCPVAWIE